MKIVSILTIILILLSSPVHSNPLVALALRAGASFIVKEQVSGFLVEKVGKPLLLELKSVIDDIISEALDKMDEQQTEGKETQELEDQFQQQQDDGQMMDDNWQMQEMEDPEAVDQQGDDETQMQEVEEEEQPEEVAEQQQEDEIQMEEEKEEEQAELRAFRKKMYNLRHHRNMYKKM